MDEKWVNGLSSKEAKQVFAAIKVSVLLCREFRASRYLENGIGYPSFLANNPCFDTATDIIEVRYLSKSQVSSSIKLLEQRGYLRREYSKCNRKTAHLRICKGAVDIIHDGQAAQEKFISIMLDGFSQEDIDSMKQQNSHILRNINAYLKGKEAE